MVPGREPLKVWFQKETPYKRGSCRSPYKEFIPLFHLMKVSKTSTISKTNVFLIVLVNIFVNVHIHNSFFIVYFYPFTKVYAFVYFNEDVLIYVYVYVQVIVLSIYV